MTTPTREELLQESRDYLQCVIDQSMSRNNAEQLAAELIEKIDAALLSAHQAQGESEPVATIIIHNGLGECRVQVERLCPELPIGMHSLYTAPPSSAQTDSEDIRNQVWNDAIEAVGLKFDAVGNDGMNSYLHRDWAFHFAASARSLKRPLQAQEPASPAAQSGAVDDPLALALDALKANHQHHQDYDEHDGYPESELCEQNTKAIAALSRVQTAPAVDLASVSDEREEVEPSPEILSSLDKVLSRPSAPAPVSEQAAAQTAGVPEVWLRSIAKNTSLSVSARDAALHLLSVLPAQPVAEQVGACSVCYGSGFDVVGKPCPFRCRPLTHPQAAQAKESGNE